jgi:hypothetical protein
MKPAVRERQFECGMPLRTPVQHKLSGRLLTESLHKDGNTQEFGSKTTGNHFDHGSNASLGRSLDELEIDSEMWSLDDGEAGPALGIALAG